MAVWRKKLRNKKTGEYRRSATWWISWREASGKRVQRSTSFGPREKWKAKRLQREKQAAASRAPQLQQAGNAPKTIEAATPSLSDLKIAFLDWLRVRRRPTTVEFYRYRLESILSWLAGQTPPVLRVLELVPEHIEQFVVAQKGSAADATINHSIKALRTALNWAVRQRRGVVVNPLACVAPITVAPIRPRRMPLSREEFERLVKATPRHRQLLWLFLVLTGCRKREAAELQLEDYRDQAVLIPAAISKNGTARTIPLPTALAEKLDDYLRSDVRTRQCRMDAALRCAEARLANMAAGKFHHRQQAIVERLRGDLGHTRLFTNRDGFPLRNNVLRMLKRDARKAGIRTIDVHVLRYTYDAWSLELGINPKTVQARMGHKRPELTVNVYAPSNYFTNRDGLNDLASVAGLSVSPDSASTAPHERLTQQESEVAKPTRELLLALAPKFSDRSLAAIFGMSPRGIGKAMARYGVERSARVINRAITPAEIAAVRASIAASLVAPSGSDGNCRDLDCGLGEP